MNKYEETFITWNSIAHIYEEKFMYFGLYNDTYDAFLDSLPKNDATILDLGCGPGNISNYLLSKNPKLNIFGIDISETMISLARTNVPSATFKVMDCRNISLIESGFNGIIAGFCWPYFSEADSEVVLKNCNRLLIDLGSLYISFVEGDYKNSGFISGKTPGRVYFYYHHLENLKLQLNRCGFEIGHIMKKKYPQSDAIDQLHTIILARKVK